MLRLARVALAVPLLMSVSEAFSFSFHFNKTLLHKSSWVIKPGPWSQRQIFFRGYESNIVNCHCKVSLWWAKIYIFCFIQSSQYFQHPHFVDDIIQAHCCSVARLCPTLCDPMDYSVQTSLSFTVSEFAQTYIHWVDDAIQAPHPLSPPSPHALNLSQHQGLFQSASSLHQMAKLLELQLQYQSFQWTFRIGFL